MLRIRHPTESHVCFLKKRWNPETALNMWSLPIDERCLCQAVVAINLPQTCPSVNRDVYEDPAEFWFTNNKRNLIRRSNWNHETLNVLLERAEYCGE